MKPFVCLLTSFLFMGLAFAQQDSSVNPVAVFDSTIQSKTNELRAKTTQINQVNQQLEDATQKAANINSRIQLLVSKKNKTEQDYKIIQEKYDSLNTAFAEKIAKSKALDSLINIKDSSAHKLDSIIIKKNTEIETQKKIADSTRKAADSTQKAEQKTIDKQQALISKQLDSLEVIAKIVMKDTLRVFNDTLKSFRPFSTKIKEVNITVREGIIMEIIVRTDAGIFRNRDAIIDLVHFGDRGKHDRLFIEHQDYHNSRLYDYSYIYLDDVIRYTTIRSYNDVAYGDFDIRLLPTDEDRTYLLRESTSINTYFSVAAFTDLKGIGGEPNGLAQFTGEAKFITRTRNYSNTALVSFNYLSFCGGLSKFDNDYKGSELYHNDSVSRKDLLQRSTYSVGIKLNLLRGFSSPRPRHLFSDLQINVGYNFLGSKIFDTLLKGASVIDTSFKTVTQNQLYFEPMATINRHRNFSITLSLPLYLVSIKKSALIKNDGWETWARPSISLMYFGKRDPGSKLFFRYNHYINLKDATQAFSQMQMGFAVNLTEVWSNKDK